MSDLDDLARAAGNLPAVRRTAVPVTRREPAVERVYIAFDAGKQKGPFTEDELRGMRAHGQLSHQTQVTVEGWGQWFPIESVLSPQAAPAANSFVAVQAQEANVDITNTTTNVTSYVNQSYHYHAPARRAKRGGSLKATGATVMLVGLVTSCLLPPVGVIVLVVGLVMVLIGLIQD